MPFQAESLNVRQSPLLPTRGRKRGKKESKTKRSPKQKRSKATSPRLSNRSSPNTKPKRGRKVYFDDSSDEDDEAVEDLNQEYDSDPSEIIVLETEVPQPLAKLVIKETETIFNLETSVNWDDLNVAINNDLNKGELAATGSFLNGLL